jgi:hypothetical protein
MFQIPDIIFEKRFLQVVALFIVCIVLIIIRVLLKHYKTQTEIDDLNDLALRLECSEFEIFQRAGQKWNFSESKIQEDFKRYLLISELPFYVRDLLRTSSSEK